MSWKNRNNLFTLMQEHTGLPVIPMVSSEIVIDDTCEHWMGALGDSHIEEYVIGEDRVHYRDENDWQEIESTLLDGVLDYEDYAALSDEEAKKMYASLPWTKAIFVDINLPE